MTALLPLLTLVHLFGLVLGVGAATVKLVLLLKCNADRTFVSTYVKVSKLITRHIVLGVVLLTLSGIGWLLLGYPFSSLLIVKIVLVAAVWVLGLLIDNVVEPKFRKLAPQPGEPATPAFTQIQKQHLILEVIATLLFYFIIVIWVLG